jgi:histidinol-phosphate aminotransferase
VPIQPLERAGAAAVPPHRRVAIAGAGRGIGAACARALRGSELILCARTASEVESVARETSGVAVVADLATDAGCAAFAAAAGKVDLAVICLGAAHRAVLLEDADRATLAAQLEANALAPALCGGALLRAGAAQLLFLSSLATRRPPMPGAAPYTASKAALEAFVRAFAEEAWPRARVNALCLGPVRTRLHEDAGTPPAWIEQFPLPDEVAPLVLALAAANVTGRIVDADALAQDPAAALAGDGHLAQAEPPQSHEHAEAEPGRRPSPRVRAALRATAPELHTYPHGLVALGERIAQLHGVLPEQVALSGGGASELLERAMRVFCAPGDEVLSPFPTFELVSALCSREGLRHRPVRARRGPDGLFLPHAAAGLLAALGPRTRIVYVASPDNPTGAVLPPAEEAALAAGLPGGTVLLIDEAWSFATAAAAPEPPTLRLRSLSKLHGLAALRVGYAIGPAPLIELLRRLELPFPLGAPQLAAALAVLDDPARARRAALLLARERARVAAALRAHGLVVSASESPVLLVRDPRRGATAGRLLFALQAASAPVQSAHWDPAALVLGLGRRRQNDAVIRAVARAFTS